jgi:tRNA pseudouridine38-40 synthase
MSSRRLRLTLGYHGTRYAGWEVQSPGKTRGRPTLQGTLEAALAEALGHAVRATAAGRTDAGVHADGQVVSFDTSSRISVAGLQRLLPRWLPSDVWIADAAEAPLDFDARRSAARRWYRYAVWRDGVPPAAWHNRCLVNTSNLDLMSMRKAVRALLGRHDFGALATRRPSGQSTRRTVFAADWLQPSASLLLFEICADAYLKQMVRAIVGSSLWVGAGHWNVDQFASALASGDRTAVGPNAPAVGLTLHRIEY